MEEGFVFDAKNFTRGILNGISKIINKREKINSINVFPVPDGDTGSNLSYTLGTSSPILKEAGENLKLCEVVKRFSESLVLNAKGNSGVILSQFFVEFQNAIKNKEKLTGREFAEAMRVAVYNTYNAIESPVEGTILTVMRKSAISAYSVSSKKNSVSEVLKEVCRTASEALVETRKTMKKLKGKDVVDAGALGFLLLMEGLYEYVQTGKYEEPDVSFEEVNQKSEYIEEETPEERFCTEAVIKSEKTDQKHLKLILAALGSSLIVMGTGKLFHIHIHTNWPQKVFDILRSEGELIKKKIDDMKAMNLEKSRGEIGIVVDSTADLPLDIAHENDIYITPLSIFIDGKNFRDGVDISRDEIWAKIVEGQADITTSQPSPNEFVTNIKRSLEKYKKVLIITLSSKLSGTYGAAQIAARNFERGRVYMFDSKMTSVGTALVALRAKEKIDEGLDDIEELIAYLHKIVKYSCFLLMVGDLKRLVKRGKINKLKGSLAMYLHIKPILSFDEAGALYAMQNAMGIQNGIKKMEQIITNTLHGDWMYDFGIPYFGFDEYVKRLTDFVAGAFSTNRIISMHASPVIGVYTGPDSIGLVGIPRL